MWLGAGIAMRLEKFGDAECALQEANVRNNQAAQVWGYMCLLCLQAGEARIKQADRARNVAERLGLKDPQLLRELGNVYTSADRLETAEALFRRSLALDETNAHTRRRLADVLSAQNAVADAVNEYLAVVDAFRALYDTLDEQAEQGEQALNLSGAGAGGGLSASPKIDKDECVEALRQCEKLLKTLGRAEEVAPLRAFRKKLTAGS